MFGRFFYMLFGLAAHHLEKKVSAVPLSPGSGRTCTEASQYMDTELNLCCEMCAPGTRLKMKCSLESDAVCEACPSGYYSEKMNYYPNCFRCPQCRADRGLQYAKRCNGSSPSVCMCKNGMFCTLRDHDHRCKECRPYTLCAPGHGATQAGMADSDVRCMPCGAGTFSDMASYTQTCRPHTDCNSQGRDVLHPGNAESDTTCGPVVRPPSIKEPATTHTSVPVTHTPCITHGVPSHPTDTMETVPRLHVTDSQSIPSVIVPAVVVILIVAAALMIVIAWMLCRKRVTADASREKKPPFCEYEGLSQQIGGATSVLKCHLLGHAHPASSLLHSPAPSLAGSSP